MKIVKKISLHYVYDNLSEITAENWNTIENTTSDFIENQQKYHKNNLLTFNHKKKIDGEFKTQKNIKNIKIQYNNNHLYHNTQVNILGHIYNDKLSFRNHIEYGLPSKNL